MENELDTTGASFGRPLRNVRHEAFARARARGLNRTVAYEHAGFAPNRRGGSRLDKRGYIKARVEALVREYEDYRESSLEETLRALIKIADAVDKTTAAGAREARLTWLEALRLSEQLKARNAGELPSPKPVRAMTEAEWDAKYGPAPPISC